MVPTKPREGDELRVITQTLAGDTNISFAILQQRRNFLWCTPGLAPAEPPGKVRESFNDLRQAITCLSMRRCNSENARRIVGKQVCEPTNITGFIQNAFCNDQ